MRFIFLQKTNPETPPIPDAETLRMLSMILLSCILGQISPFPSFLAFLSLDFVSLFLRLITPFVLSIELIVFHLGVMTAVRFYVQEKYAIIKYNYVSMALILSSFGKFIIVPMVIWDYNDMEYAWFVNVFVVTSNAEALSGQPKKTTFPFLLFLILLLFNTIFLSLLLQCFLMWRIGKPS